MLRPKKEKTQRIKLSKESIRKAKNIFIYLKPYRTSFTIGWIFLVLSTSAGLFFPFLMGNLLGSSKVNVQNSAEAVGLINFNNINEVAFALFLLFGFQALF